MLSPRQQLPAQGSSVQEVLEILCICNRCNSCCCLLAAGVSHWLSALCIASQPSFLVQCMIEPTIAEMHHCELDKAWSPGH